MTDLKSKLAELNLALPEPPKPVASYVPAVRSGDLIVVSGQLPMKDGKLIATGKTPSVVSIESAKSAAQQCALNALAIVGAEIGGDWSRLVRIVRVGVFVQSDDGFAQQPQVANGASDLMQKLFGDAGRHARAAVGVNALPLDATVEVEMLVHVR